MRWQQKSQTLAHPSSLYIITYDVVLKWFVNTVNT